MLEVSDVLDLVDRGFDLELPVLSRVGHGSDLAQILSGRGSPGGVLFDNEDQFRFYARWRYRLERHLSNLNRLNRLNRAE